MDCDPWDSCFCMMRVRKADPPSAVGGLEGIVDGLGYLLLLAHEYAAGVSWIAAVEGEQQIQSWEVKDINLWATA